MFNFAIRPLSTKLLFPVTVSVILFLYFRRMIKYFIEPSLKFTQIFYVTPIAGQTDCSGIKTIQ